MLKLGLTFLLYSGAAQSLAFMDSIESALSAIPVPKYGLRKGDPSAVVIGLCSMIVGGCSADWVNNNVMSPIKKRYYKDDYGLDQLYKTVHEDYFIHMQYHMKPECRNFYDQKPVFVVPDMSSILHFLPQSAKNTIDEYYRLLNLPEDDYQVFYAEPGVLAAIEGARAQLKRSLLLRSLPVITVGIGITTGLLAACIGYMGYVKTADYLYSKYA